MCGSVLIILPSDFSGAALKLSHEGHKTISFVPQKSVISTCIVASYVGVTHKLAAVNSGYRLSLSYKLIVPPLVTTSFPLLPNMAGVQGGLRDTLTSWKLDSSPEAPVVLGCLLRHQYHGVPNFWSASLRGADALLLSHLRPLAQRLGFRVYLAHVTLKTPDISEDLKMKRVSEEFKVDKIFSLDGEPSRIEKLGWDHRLSDIVGGDMRSRECDYREKHDTYPVVGDSDDNRLLINFSS